MIGPTTFRCFASLALSALLAVGCAAPPPAPNSTEAQAKFDARVKLLDAVESWRAKGRVGLRSDQERWAATVHWEHARTDFRIQLSGPFGQGAARIIGSEAGVELLTADGQRRFAKNPEALLERELGWRVPISGLKDWILGRPAGQLGESRLLLDAEGRLTGLEQAGWSIDYSAYHENIDLPRRMSVSRGLVEAQFSIREWVVRPGAVQSALKGDGSLARRGQ
ncbi:MAG: lipoprotein insertase outer membrane protein LolB [Pseudomonadota bacterium]